MVSRISSGGGDPGCHGKWKKTPPSGVCWLSTGFGFEIGLTLYSGFAETNAQNTLQDGAGQALRCSVVRPWLNP
jgi:hypothetical protein